MLILDLRKLQQHAVAYINSDGNGRGTMSAEGSHSLENFVNNVMKDIQDPETKMTVWQRRHLTEIARAPASRRQDNARREQEAIAQEREAAGEPQRLRSTLKRVGQSLRALGHERRQTQLRRRAICMCAKDGVRMRVRYDWEPPSLTR